MTMSKVPAFITNLLSVYSANAVNGVLGIVAVPLVVSALGNEGYGIYSIYVILASYVAIIDCGVTKHFVRLMSSAPDKDNPLVTIPSWCNCSRVVSIPSRPKSKE